MPKTSRTMASEAQVPPPPHATPTDPYARSADLDEATADALAARLETRGNEPGQRALRQSFLSRIPRTSGVRVLEVGCGTGVVTRELASLPGIDQTVGIDPSPRFIERARAANPCDGALRFDVGDGQTLPYDDTTFDVVVFATTLCHVVDPTSALAEAYRVLTPGGTLLVFDGDYATATVARSNDDPLQACVTAALGRLVHDPWLVRRLRSLVAASGFADADLKSHGYVETTSATYTPTVVDFGADALARDGVIDTETASALKEEARRRIESETFFGHMAYASLLASRPHDPEAFADPLTGVPPVLRRAIEAYNERDADRLGACYAHDATFGSPVVAVDGAGQIANLWRAWFTAFPDVVSRLEHIVVDGATAIVRWTESGTHTGVLSVAGLDYPATGKRLEWHGTSTYRIDQSAIASVTYEFDSQALLAVIVTDGPNT